MGFSALSGNIRAAFFFFFWCDPIVLLNCIGVFIVLLLLPPHFALSGWVDHWSLLPCLLFLNSMKFPLLGSLQLLTLALMTEVFLLWLFRSLSLIQRLESWLWSFSKFNRPNLNSLVSIRENCFLFYILFQRMMYIQLYIIRQDGSETAAEFDLHGLKLF